jgi:hypothetical protein
MTRTKWDTARPARFPIGTQFKTRGKKPRLCTVTDILKTFNSAGEQVSLCYVAEHEFMGQILTDNAVTETAIAMGQGVDPNCWQLRSPF